MFTHLHCHSFYSFSRGTIATRELPLLALKHGMTSIALTDTNNLSGAMEFYLACKQWGIKPILGVELRTRHEVAVLLAKNAIGYKEICDVVSKVLAAIPQTKPKLTLESDEPGTVEIKEESTAYHPLAPFLDATLQNTIVISSSPSVLRDVMRSNPELLAQHALYMELTPHERNKWKQLREIYWHHAIPVVASNDVLFHTPSEHALHTLLRAIGTNTTTSTLPAWEIGSRSQSFVSESEFKRLIGAVGEEAFRNIGLIADACNVELDLAHSKFARFPVADPCQYLKALAEAGFRSKYPHPSDIHRDRFAYELQTINALNATSYFLVTHDMIQFAKSKNFPHLGRGSGANSMIAYCLGISNVDPIACDLRFERFLNPERSMPPDFDIDFSWNDRYEVIHYVLDKYGRENTAMLSTIQTYRDRGSIREVGKALGCGEAEINEQMATMRTVRAQREKADIKTIEQQNRHSDIREWMVLASRIEGFPRHLSVHAGGVLLCDRPITHYTPVQDAPIGVKITHQDMHSAEDWKLIKLDILATRGLGTFRDTMDLVEKRYGVRPPVEDERIAFNDARTMDLIRSGKTKGCFYIESPAMISLLRKLETDTFEGLTAASSVIRPGVAQSGMMQEYIARHRDPERRKAADPLLYKLMPLTYGIMIYQEDVLTVAHEVAGLSYGEADLLRRAMSGKSRSFERMRDLKDRFIDGAKAKGITDAVAHDIWRQIESFAGYSFCKAHSASYAVLSFQKAWLKVYHPAEFICSVLNNEGGFYRHQEYVNEAKKLGVKVLVPDVNKSEFRHTVESDMTIRLGFRCVKGFSQHSLESLLKHREAEGDYRSIEDFASRSGVTPEDAALLIKLGICNSIHARPAEAQMIVRGMMLGTNRGRQKQDTLRLALEMPSIATTYDLSAIEAYDPLYIFRQERNNLGYSVTNHPCDFLHPTDARVGAKKITRSSEVKNSVGKTVTILGHISASKTTHTRKGERMLMLNVSDAFNMMDIVVWPDVLKRYYTEIVTAEALTITGRVTESFGVQTIEAQTIQKAEFSAAKIDREEKLKIYGSN